MAQDTHLAAGRRALDGVLALVQVLLEALMFAAAVATIVFLLPGKFAVLVLGLYGFICVWFLQIAALLIALVMAVRGMLSNEMRADTRKAVLLCAGFLIAIALNNTYILMLHDLWGKNFAVAVNDVPLLRFITFDQHILAFAGTVFAVLGDFLDHLAVTIFHLHQPPLTNLFAVVGAAFAHMTAAVADAATRTALVGFVAGLVFAVWVRAAKRAA